MNLPVCDLHCDLLSYLGFAGNADPLNTEDIGCSLPALEAGNVKCQVMAIYTATEKGSSLQGLKQSEIFNGLLQQHDSRVHFPDKEISGQNDSRINILAAIENASGFCEEDEPLDMGFAMLDKIRRNVKKIIYIGLTHHGENRFAGGNSTRTGLKDDGRKLLEHLSGKKIAIDLSHASDATAYGIFDHIDKLGLDVPVLASHSNFRKVWDHPRNLPDDIAKEIIKRKGPIGMNFLRAFLHTENADALYEHIQYGISLGGEDSVCFGADYFYTADHPDQSRKPFFYEEQSNASYYPQILGRLSGFVTEAQLKKIASGNALRFLTELI